MGMTNSKYQNHLSQSVGEYLSTLYLIAFSILSLGGIMTAEFRIAIGEVAPFLYAFALAGAVVLVPVPSKLNWTSATIWGAFMVIGLVFWVLSPFWDSVIWNTLGTVHADGWNHVTRGLYLWHYPRGETGNLAPIFQYASHLSETRWGASSIIALLSIFSIPGDPSASLGLFFVCTLIAAFSSYCLLAKELPIVRSMRLPFAVFAVALGWTLEMLNVGNYENYLFVVYPPSIIALILKAKRITPNWKEASILAIMITNSGAGYPEGFGVFFVLILPIVVSIFIVRREKNVIFGFYVPLVLTVIILGSKSFYRSLQQLLVQFSSASIDQAVDAIRPGEGVFPQLLGVGFPAAFMGIGPANHGDTHFGIIILSYGILMPVIVVGVCHFWKMERSMVYSIVGLFLLIVWQGALSKYDYGLYKISTISHPIWISLIFVGLQLSIRYIIKGKRVFGWASEKVVLALACFGIVVCSKVNTTDLRLYDRSKYTVLKNLNFSEIKNGIRLDVKSNIDHVWLVYFLRNVRLSSTSWRSYIGQPHLRPYMNKSLRPTSENLPVLCLGDGDNAIWTNGEFCILEPDALSLKGVDNPNGIEVSDGMSYIWVSNEYTRFYIQSPSEGLFKLRCEGMFLGPSRPNAVSLTLEVEDGEGVRSEVVRSDTESIDMFLRKGDNSVSLRAVDRPSVDELPNGDRRALLLGIRDYRIDYSQNE
jgi:hypothetical protein